MPTKHYVGNLSFEVTEEELRQLFLRAGKAKSAPAAAEDEVNEEDLRQVFLRQLQAGVDLVSSAAGDRNTGRPRGFAEASSKEEGEVRVKIEPHEGGVEIMPLTGEDRLAEKQAGAVLRQIALSRKRARKTQAEISRLKKKTQVKLERLQ